MSDRFAKSLRQVGLVHGVFLLLLIAVEFLPRMIRPKRERELEFTVDVSSLEELQPEVAAPTPAPPVPDTPEDIPEETPKPPEKTKPKPPEKPKPPKPPEKPKPPTPRPPKPNPLTRDQIRDLLIKGAKPSDHTAIPTDSDDRSLAVVQNRLYAAWTEPSASEVGNAKTLVEIELDGMGRLTARRIKRGSGNAVMDNSVMDAVNSVKQITGLPVDFLRRYQRITIEFDLEPDAN